MGTLSIFVYTILHLAMMSVTMSAAIIFHTADQNLTGDKLVQGACWVMTILTPILVVVTLFSAWSPGCSFRVPLKYPYLNQALLGGFLIVFVATLQLLFWMLLRTYQSDVKADLDAAKAAYKDVDPSGLIPAAVYLQCVVLGFTIMNPIVGLANYASL